MLFDLRAPGRKRAVQAVYVVLAVVLVGGTILFGVGTGLPGIFGGGNNNTSTTSLSDQNKDRLDGLQRRVAANPKDAAAWGTIASVRFAVGTEQIPPDATTAPPAAKAEYAKAAAAWDKYIALNPDPVDIQVANRMATAFSPENLNRPAEWAEAQGLATQAVEEKAQKDGTDVPVDTYVALLQAQYAAKRTRQAKITEAKMRAITPKSETAALDATIALAKNPNDTKAQAALAKATGSGGTTGGTVTLPEDDK
jgi:tetratricopeptide (TPR) repeat protein